MVSSRLSVIGATIPGLSFAEDLVVCREAGVEGLTGGRWLVVSAGRHVISGG